MICSNVHLQELHGHVKSYLSLDLRVHKVLLGYQNNVYSI